MTGFATARPPAAWRAPGTAWAMRLAAACGVLAPIVYVGADVMASLRYPGYHYADQAVSELFAIGAPTSTMVVRLFTISSTLTLAFVIGLWRDSRGLRWRRLLAAMLGIAAVNALLLWNLFPMHRRGEPTSMTDTMHLALAANPAVLLGLVFAAVGFHGRFRAWTVATLVLILTLASYGFSLAAPLAANAPTPWLGLAERAAQYAHGAWQVLLVATWWRERGFKYRY